MSLVMETFVFAAVVCIAVCIAILGLSLVFAHLGQLVERILPS